MANSGSRILTVLMTTFVGLGAMSSEVQAQSSPVWREVNHDVYWPDDHASGVAIDAASGTQQYVACVNALYPWGATGRCDSDGYSIDGVGYEGIFPGPSCTAGSVAYAAWVFSSKYPNQYETYVLDGSIDSGYSVQKYVCE